MAAKEINEILYNDMDWSKTQAQYVSGTRLTPFQTRLLDRLRVHVASQFTDQRDPLVTDLLDAFGLSYNGTPVEPRS